MITNIFCQPCLWKLCYLTSFFKDSTLFSKCSQNAIKGRIGWNQIPQINQEWRMPWASSPGSNA